MATAALDDRLRPATDFLARLRVPRVPYISPARLAEVLGVSLGRVAELAGVHRNTLANPASERVQNGLRAIVKVVSRAETLAGDADRAIFWFLNEPIIVYRHRTAADLVADGHVDAVLAFLDDLEDGAKG